MDNKSSSSKLRIHLKIPPSLQTKSKISTEAIIFEASSKTNLFAQSKQKNLNCNNNDSTSYDTGNTISKSASPPHLNEYNVLNNLVPKTRKEEEEEDKICKKKRRSKDTHWVRRSIRGSAFVSEEEALRQLFQSQQNSNNEAATQSSPLEESNINSSMISKLTDDNLNDDSRGCHLEQPSEVCIDMNSNKDETVVPKKKRGRKKKVKRGRKRKADTEQEINTSVDSKVSLPSNHLSKGTTGAFDNSFKKKKRTIKKSMSSAADPTSHWVRRSVRMPHRSELTTKNVLDLIDKLKNNHQDVKVLKLKRWLGPDTPQIVMDQVLEALEVNENCEALYIQNFNDGMRDEQMLHLLKVLKKCRIWCLNIGETYQVSMKTWSKFAKGLKKTHLTHTYASEHTITSKIKEEIRNNIRCNRQKHTRHIDPGNLNVILQCTHCWWNPINAKVLRPYITGKEHLLGRDHDDKVVTISPTQHQDDLLTVSKACTSFHQNRDDDNVLCSDDENRSPRNIGCLDSINNGGGGSLVEKKLDVNVVEDKSLDESSSSAATFTFLPLNSRSVMNDEIVDC